MNKWRALKVACGILVAVLAFRVFYFQELFFPFLRVLVLWLAPTVTTTAHVLLVCQRLLSYPFHGLMQGWLRSFWFDAVQLRQDAERALKDLRLRVKQS